MSLSGCCSVADGLGQGLSSVLVNSGLDDDDASMYVTALSEPGAMTAALNWFRAMDATALGDLRPVSVPTLYVWSTGDGAFGRDVAEATADHVCGPYAFEVLEGVSHWIPELAPEQALGLPRAASRVHLRAPRGRWTVCDNERVSTPNFDLTDVQRDFRETMRTFAEEKVAPNATEADRNAEFPWKSFEACKEMELPALGIPEAYGGAGRGHGDPGHCRRGAGPGVRLDRAHHPDLEAGDDPGHELGQRGTQADLHAAGCSRRDPSQLLPVRSRRRKRCCLHAI